jgi:hypothetical protein
MHEPVLELAALTMELFGFVTTTTILFSHPAGIWPTMRRKLPKDAKRILPTAQGSAVIVGSASGTMKPKVTFSPLSYVF